MSNWMFEMLPEGAFTPRPGGAMRLHGGKGSDAPAPDPELIKAQIKSLGIQDSVVQKMMTNSDMMQPYQLDQLKFGLETARTAYDQSQQDRDWTLGKRHQLDRAQQPLVEMATNFSESDRRSDMMGEASADITQAFDAAEEQGLRTMGRMGINPSSGKMAAFVNQNNIQEALAKASAGRNASAAARAEGIQLKSNAANMLSGYPSMGMQSTAAGAGYGGLGLSTANAGLQGMNSGYGATGQMAGQMGSNAGSMWGAQANYKLGSDKQAADNDPFAALLGGAVQLGAAGIGKYSDRRLKKDIVLVGRDERTGLNLYEFSYRDMPGQRWRGVMADEVLQVMPQAVLTAADGFMRVNYSALGIEMVAMEGTSA